MAWLSPAYPVGAFSYSHGLEYAVEAELVGDLAAFESWAAGVLRFGAGHTDAVLFSHAWRAVSEDDPVRFDEVLELAAALRGTAELALESSAPGEAFLSTVRRSAPPPDLDVWLARIERQGCAMSYPVAVGLTTALADIDRQLALTAFLHAFAANLVSAAVRLVPLGQTDGQRALVELEAVALRTAEDAAAVSLDDLGSAALMVDWASMQHETQYTRLFRS